MLEAAKDFACVRGSQRLIVFKAAKDFAHVRGSQRLFVLKAAKNFDCVRGSQTLLVLEVAKDFGLCVRGQRLCKFFISHCQNLTEYSVMTTEKIVVAYYQC